jgi:hypothetical protein
MFMAAITLYVGKAIAGFYEYPKKGKLYVRCNHLLRYLYSLGNFLRLKSEQQTVYDEAKSSSKRTRASV